MPTMPALPRRLELTGGDYFIHAIDRQMRQAGIPGNVCRMALRLEGDLDAPRLRAALQSSPLGAWLGGVRMTRLLPVLSPRWRAAAGKGIELREHPARDIAECGLRIADCATGLRADRAPGIAFDLYPLDGGADLVLSWHHALMDVQGAELLLRHLRDHAAGAAGDTNILFSPAQLPTTVRQRLRGYGQKVLFARRSLHFITSTCREPLCSLMPARRPAATCRVDYRALWFSAEETARIDARCERLNAAFRRSHFHLACCAQAFHAVAAERGAAGAYVVPVPHNLRRRAGSGPILSNQVSFLFYRIEPEQAPSLEATIAELTRQMMAQARDRNPESFQAAMELFKPTPLGFYLGQLGRPTRGKFATFFFSDAGESCPGMDEFFGARLAAVTHYAPAARPPGLTFVFSRTRGRLCAVISRVSDCLTGAELERLERGLRAALLGGEDGA